jgi:uncharacterized protein with PIN domain
VSRLLADVMLGKLARYLRFCGHDAAYALDRGVEADDELLAWAAREDRRLLTRDRELATRADDGLLLSTRAVEDQLRELADAGLDLSMRPPARCGACNGELVADGGSPPSHAPDDVGAFWRCTDCGQAFWKGSHWDDVAATLAAL